MMIRRVVPPLGLILPVPAPVGLCLIVGFVLCAAFFTTFYIDSISQPQIGPILFWQNDTLYTINADGSNLQRITRANQADQRFVEVAPGCHGTVEAQCWILIGHVLYHISGRGVPLPLTESQAWLNSAASWSPDGIHIVYPVTNETSGHRSLLLYDTESEIVWQVVTGIDDSIKPTWSPGCATSLSSDCSLAYALKSQAGQTGVPLQTLNFGSGRAEAWHIPAGRGNILRWSHDNRLYYGRTEWYYVDDGSRVVPFVENYAASTLSPSADYVTYISAGTEAACGNCLVNEVWLADAAAEQPQSIYTFAFPGHQDGFTYSVFWAPQGDAFATFRNGQLLYHNLVQGKTSIWYETRAMETLDSYAFSPSGDALVMVEGIYFDNPERPRHRLFVVNELGEVTTLRPRSRAPIVVLAWLPKPPPDYFPEIDYGELANRTIFIFSGVKL